MVTLEGKGISIRGHGGMRLLEEYVRASSILLHNSTCVRILHDQLSEIA